MSHDNAQTRKPTYHLGGAYSLTSSRPRNPCKSAIQSAFLDLFCDSEDLEKCKQSEEGERSGQQNGVFEALGEVEIPMG